MTRHLCARLLTALAFVFAVSSVAFLIARAAPGDFVDVTLGTTASATDADAMRHRLGLDRSVVDDYGHWLRQVASLDLGASFQNGQPVAATVKARAANSALIAFPALILATVLGIASGVVGGVTADRWPGRLMTTLSTVFTASPPILTALVLLYLAARTGWLPVSGMRSVIGPATWTDLAWHMIVPVLALALPLSASFERIQARAMTETLAAPFVAAARARGVGETGVVWRVALKPSLRSLASVYGLAAAGLMSGSFAVEVLTAWPGLGRLMVDALLVRDVPLVAGCAGAGALILAVAGLLGDLLLTAVDPRVTE